MTDYAVVMQVIRTTLLRRGDGVNTPIRVIIQYWSLDGELLAEDDPIPEANPCARCGAIGLVHEVHQ